MSDSRFSDPSFVLGAIVAQIEDLDHGDRIDVLQRALAAELAVATDKGALAIRRLATRQIAKVLDSAEAHGQQSDPDHETGDLLDFLQILSEEADPEAVIRAAARYWSDGREVWT